MDAVADSKQAEVNINVFEDVEPAKFIVVSWRPSVVGSS